MAKTTSLIDDPAVAELLGRRDLSQPVGMLNLLKFRDQALYELESGEAPCTGEEAYARYAALVRPILEPMGVTVILTGVAWFIGPANEWDRAFVVRYARGGDIYNLGTDQAYARVAHHRTAALADSRLLMMDFDPSGLA